VSKAFTPISIVVGVVLVCGIGWWVLTRFRDRRSPAVDPEG
jgi:hypothetical protein